MRNKKLVAMSLVVALTFTACGKTTQKEETTTPTPIIEETNDQITGESTEEVVEEITEEGNEEAPVEEAGALASDETLDKIHEATIEKLGDDYVADMPYDALLVDEMFGVNADWYDAAIAEGPMMSGHVDKFLAFHATEGNLENIKQALETYRETQMADIHQYPMNLNKIHGSVVETVGDYVFFVMVGFIDEMAYETEDQMIEAHQEINESIIEIAKGIIE